MAVMQSVQGFIIATHGRPWMLLCPPKAEVTSSNLVGRASSINYLARVVMQLPHRLSAKCPRNTFGPRSLSSHGG
jgi:hypothetical protein